MPWFTPEASEFFADLSRNNNREWFEANKKRYEKDVKRPLEALAGELIPRLTELYPGITTTPKSAPFRLNRDTRFSKDKTPYKEHAAMVIAPGGRHEPGSAGLYFHFDHNHLTIASGLYFLEPAQLTKVRQHIVDHGPELHKLLDEKSFKAHFKEMQGDKNKILPPEFKEAAAKEPLIFNKQFFFWVQHPAAELLRDDLPEFVMAHMNACHPLNEFLTAPLKN